VCGGGGGFKRIVQLKFANSMVKVKQVQVQYTITRYGACMAYLLSSIIRNSISPHLQVKCVHP
jgi:hypothetical protein